MIEPALLWADTTEKVSSAWTSSIVYADSLPLSDLLIGPSGQLCFLRRRPLVVDIVVLRESGAAPTAWVKNYSGKVLQLFGFDGEQVFANTGSSVLRVVPGGSEVIHESPSPVRAPSFDRSTQLLLWMAGARRHKPFVLDRRSSRVPRELLSGASCFQAAWCGEKQVAVQTMGGPGSEDYQSTFSLHSSDGTLVRQLLSTRRSIQYLGGAGDSGVRGFSVAAAGFVASNDSEALARAISEDPAAPEGQTNGVWLVKLDSEPLVPRFVSPRVPRSAPSMIADRLLFVAPGDSGGSLIVAAQAGRASAVDVPEYLREIVFDPATEAVLYIRLRPDGGGSIVAVHAEDLFS